MHQDRWLPQRLSVRTIDALYALRCSLAHNFSLFNEGQGRRASELTFHFALRADATSPLVSHAKRRWPSTPGQATGANRTWINLEALGDLAEGCAAGVLAAFASGRLATRLTPDELIERYTFTVM